MSFIFPPVIDQPTDWLNDMRTVTRSENMVKERLNEKVVQARKHLLLSDSDLGSKNYIMSRNLLTGWLTGSLTPPPSHEVTSIS